MQMLSISIQRVGKKFKFYREINGFSKKKLYKNMFYDMITGENKREYAERIGIA